MPQQYKAPIEDIKFVLHDLLHVEKVYDTMPAFAGTDTATVDGILEAAASFSESELSPLNQIGDRDGCKYNDGVVTTPPGFKEAYKKYIELGYPSLSVPVEYGGQGLPGSLGTVVSEMVGTANWSWSMYPGLSHGAIRTIEHHGSPEQKARYLPHLVEGTWTGTMCLTEPQAGSDLGLIRSRAEPNADGTYSITGQKIFISAGEHDMAENIIHIVLARLPGAPSGTKGISLFIVPKIWVKEDGSLGDRNTLRCGALEHKMGIHGNATCVMNFDSAKGYLIGPENRGLNCMFTFMNTARIGTAVQGLAAAEGSFQGSLPYARERLAMRSLATPQTQNEADPIIDHPAVRNMLLIQKSIAEGGRALVYQMAVYGDLVEAGDTEEIRKEADALLSFLTPIGKAFLTELGLECSSHGIQVYGGHGYIWEWGMEQIMRDTRIACLYEGTTEIQSLDLLGRKVLQTQGALLKIFTKQIHKFCEANRDDPDMAQFIRPLAELNREWGEITMKIGMKAMQDPNEVGACAVDYMYYSGYVTLAFMWAQMALVSLKKLKAGEGDKTFYETKIKTAQFFYQKMVPRTRSHVACMETGPATLMSISAEDFSK